VPAATARRGIDVEASVRRVRWVSVGFAALQFLLYTPSPDAGPLPFPRLPWALAVMAVLVATNVVSRATGRMSTDTARRVGYAETAVDTAVVVVVLWLFGFDPDVRLWPLLTFPVVEGALRAELPGALAVWAGGSAAYGVEQVLHGTARGDTLAIIVPAITFAAGILLFVGVGMGLLARRLAAADERSVAENERLRRLADASHHLVSGADADEVSARFVAASSELTGLARAALMEHVGGDLWMRRAGVGLQPAFAEPDATPRPEPLYTLLARSLDGPTEVPVDTEVADVMRRAAPSVRRLAAAPVRQEGQLLGMLLLGSDVDAPPLDEERTHLVAVLAANAAVAITAARVAEARDRTIAELEHLDEVKDDFLAILTHELRSPMTIMSGYADLLLRRWDDVTPEQRQEFLLSIDRNTRLLAQLIDDVFDALRAERTELPVDLEAVDLVPIVEETVERHVTPSPGHTARVVHRPGLPHVLADGDRVRQIVDNLVSNAVKYSPRGGLVEVCLAPGDGHVTIAVADEGLGIPARERGRLFGKFARLHPGERIRGTGLGLYLTRQLAEAMGGSIEVDSTEGAGSTFTVRLPAVPSER
jgi:signal transduction histidine kinase